MAQSAKLRFLNAFQGNDKKKTSLSSNQPDNVHGWLMNVHTYREPEEIATTIVDEDNNSIPIENPRRNGRPGSITSEDSVNLDELINANFTADVDDETDLPDLAALDLDDSTDEFWKLDQVTDNTISKPSNSSFLTTKNYDLDWNPTDDDTTTDNLSPVMPRYEKSSRLRRSESISSENSFNSQTTITQYAKYGLTPVIHPSESTSTSSRSLSRLSNYSTASSNTTTGIPRPRTSSAATNHHTNIPTPSRSHTLQKDVSPKRTPIVKRASHIPAPASNYHISSPPTPQRTISSSSATSSSSSQLRIPNKTQKRIPQRASHIPTVRESIHRPNSPLQPKSGRASATPTRMGLHSPQPSGGGPRNILSPPKEEKRQTFLRSPSRIGTLKRNPQ